MFDFGSESWLSQSKLILMALTSVQQANNEFDFPGATEFYDVKACFFLKIIRGNFSSNQACTQKIMIILKIKEVCWQHQYSSPNMIHIESRQLTAFSLFSPIIACVV